MGSRSRAATLRCRTASRAARMSLRQRDRHVFRSTQRHARQDRRDAREPCKSGRIRRLAPCALRRRDERTGQQTWWLYVLPGDRKIGRPLPGHVRVRSWSATVIRLHVIGTMVARRAQKKRMSVETAGTPEGAPAVMPSDFPSCVRNDWDSVHFSLQPRMKAALMKGCDQFLVPD